MTMKKNRKELTIKQSFVLSFVIPGALAFLILVGGMTLIAIYGKTNNRAILIAGIVYTLVLAITYTVVSIFSYHALKRIYFDGLYRTTALTLRGFKNNVPSNSKYPVTRIKEINELNFDLEQVNTIISNSTMISADLDSAFIPLVFIDEDAKLVTLDSFKKELRALIYSSQNFRNVLIEAFYDLDEDTLTKEESYRVINILTESFNDYDHYIFAPNDNGTGFYLYLPRMDSFSHIKERLTGAMKNLSITKKTFDGLATINVRFSIVCYPYSNINELFPDLMYAKRQGQVLNLYLPNRLSALSDSKILQNALNLNNMSRVLENLTDLKVSTRERKKSMDIIRRTMSSLIMYLNIDFAGIILFDEINNSYSSSISLSLSKEFIFKEGGVVEKGFVEALDDAEDEDDSFYFSSRRHASVSLARYLDKINVSGGFYYTIRDQGRIIGVIYFFNKVRDLLIDSYIRETLFIFSYRIGDFLSIAHEEDKVNETYKEINNILMTSDFALYRIDRLTYELVGFSAHFNTLFPKAKYNTGEKCYKALYDLDSPCSNCPLKTSKKMISEIRGGKIETSLTINNAKTKLIRMLVHTLPKGADVQEYGDRFDKDLLINSFYSMKLALNDLYTINARGYLLLLRLDNLDLLLKEAGSEGYLYLLRQFVAVIKEIKISNSNIFNYSTQAIAVLMPEIGQVNMINFIENIYEISKRKYQYNGSEYSFDVTYLPYSFPQQYPSSDDFLKFVLRHFNSLNYQINRDMITLPDSDYTRSASRTEFMLSVIDDQFGNKTFSVALQPFVKITDNTIYGAELLIRLSDNYRNSVFSADELIKVAGQNGKISLISNALINYVGELYKQHALTIFKVSGFQRLTINTDFSFFDDPDFFQNLFDTFNTYNFQKNFLGFEITEKEIFTHLGEFKKISKGILNHHIALVCDQYSGEFMPMDTLKELGFSEIKIGRYLVKDIEVNPKHLNEITSIDKLARDNGLKVTFVGVENVDQYRLLKEMDKNCMCQGYYFYRPLEDYKLIDELRKNNNGPRSGDFKIGD